MRPKACCPDGRGLYACMLTLMTNHKTTSPWANEQEIINGYWLNIVMRVLHHFRDHQVPASSGTTAGISLMNGHFGATGKRLTFRHLGSIHEAIILEHPALSSLGFRL